MCFKVGGRWWVHRDDFYAYLESCQVMTGVSLKDFEQRRQRKQAVAPTPAKKNWDLDK